MQKFEYKWTDIDISRDSDYFIDYLETLNSLDTIQSLKKHSYKLMEIKQGNHILDIGCGTGKDAIELAKIVGMSGKIVGIDNSNALISEAKNKAKNMNLPINFKLMNANSLKFPDNTFDACRAERIFQHLDNPQYALAEMIRVSRLGGCIVVIDPDWETLVIDAPNTDLTRRILKFKGPRNKWCGRQLYRLFKEAKLTHIIIFTTTIILTDFINANKIFGLQATINYLVKNGELSEIDAFNWLNYLENNSKKGLFFSALTFFGIRGIKY